MGCPDAETDGGVPEAGWTAWILGLMVKFLGGKAEHATVGVVPRTEWEARTLGWKVQCRVFV